MAKPAQIELSADTSYAEAAATIVSTRADELAGHARGVLDTSDIERVHDMRVATRRLRAALEVFQPRFPGKPYRRTLSDVKQLADALGERRDRDVAIVGMTGFNEQMAVPDRRGVASLIERLRDEQAEANLGLSSLVEEARLKSLREGIEELVAAARERAPEEAA